MSISALEKMKNLEPRVRKSDGERRRTSSRNDAVGKELEAANDVKSMGKLAVKYGLTEDEIVKRGREAPNFGQFRMVLGNRIRGVVARRKKDPGLTMAAAAYPVRKSRTPGKKVIKKVGKKVGKKVTTSPR